MYHAHMSMLPGNK